MTCLHRLAYAAATVAARCADRLLLPDPVVWSAPFDSSAGGPPAAGRGSLPYVPPRVTPLAGRGVQQHRSP